MDQTKIQEILGRLKSVPGFNPGSLSDEFLVQLVYPLFQKPSMNKTEALEFTRIVLGIKDPKEKEYQINKEDKKILLKLTGDVALYGNEKEDTEKLNENSNIINSNSGSINPNPYGSGVNYNPGLDNEYITSFIAKYSKDRNLNKQNRFIIDPPDLLRKKKLNTSLISSEIIKNGYATEGTKDEYDYWGNLVGSEKSGIKQNSNLFLGRDESLPLNYDEYNDYKKGITIGPNYAKKAKNVQRTEEEILNQKKLKQDLKNRLGELMAISNSTKEELTRLMTVSAPGILTTIAAVVSQVSAFASSPYTIAAIMPTLKSGLKGVKDVTTSILTELDTIKGLGIQFMSGIYDLGNGPELNALFLPCVAMFDILDSIYSLFGGGKGGRSTLQNAEEGESNKQKRIFQFNFTKSLYDYELNEKCKLSDQELVVDDKEYGPKDNTLIQLNENNSLTFNGILYYETELFISGIKEEKNAYKYDNNDIKIDVYNDDGSLKDSYTYALYITGSKKVKYTYVTTDEQGKEKDKTVTTIKAYSFGLKELNGKQKPDDFIITIVKNVENYFKQQSDLDYGKSCKADVYIINGKNIKINDEPFKPFKYDLECEKSYVMDGWDRKETNEYKNTEGKICYNKVKQSEGQKEQGVQVVLSFDNLNKVEKIDDRTRYSGGKLSIMHVNSYSKLNIFGDCAYLEKDASENIIKEERYFEINSLNSNKRHSKGVNDDPYDERNYYICDCRDPLQALKDGTNYTENDEGERYYSFEVKDDARYLEIINLNGAVFEKIEIENFQDV